MGRLTVVWTFIAIAVCSLILCGDAGAQEGAADGQWTERAGDKGASLYSPLNQINLRNVKDLQAVWRWKSVDAALIRTKPDLERISRVYHYEATPLVVDGIMYTSTSLGQVAAIDPRYGETLWTYDSKAYESGRPTNLGFLTRGLTYWESDGKKRLFHAPNDAYLISIDPETGKPDPEFGVEGKVDLTQNLGVTVTDRREFLRAYTITSPPIVCADVIVVGSSIRDTPNFKELPPGHIRGYDAHTGKHLWTFHTIPQPGEFGNDTWENDSWKDVGSVNAWPPMSADDELGFVYAAIGTPSHNWYGVHRPGDNLFACSVVCLNAKTGERVWHFQLTHHPVWDWDPPAAPNLIDITVDGKPVKALAQLTKQGLLFTFNRKTGEPIWPIVETPVPQNGMPGEKLSPTQPIPSKPAPFEPGGATPDMFTRLTPDLRAEVVEMAGDWTLGPLYTPPTEQGTLVNPGWSGGGNWNGAAWDPETHILYVPSYTNYNLVKLVKPDPNRSNFDFVWGGSNTPHVQGLPIFHPPFSRLTAIDMDKGEHLWQIPIGAGQQAHPALEALEDLPDLGRGLSDGEMFPLLTKELLFITQDKNENYPPNSPPMFYALDKRTGEKVWEYELPASVHATPMTLLVEEKQYIVLALGAGLFSSGVEPDELIAFALP